ncbi:MAG: histidine kinase dimerization/phospho-acceptor domain-containing protein [Clostridiales bacterium]|nr:histidine kinase dimerization/phospho-acceptor domain-containing protein [Clostridiales bacterium]
MGNNVIVLILLAVIIAALLTIFALAQRIYKIKIQLAGVFDVLDDISHGNNNRRILAHPEDITASICYKINAIVKGYRDKILDLNQAAEANHRLMTSLSHDIRTPLTSIIGYLDVAVQKNDDQRTADITIARQKAHDMKDYVDTLFVWCKLNSGEESFQIEQLDLAELTRNILQD